MLSENLIFLRDWSFNEWNGDALIASLKDKSLRKIKYDKNEFINEEIIFKGNIGRIRDIKIHKETGDLYMLSDKGELWRMFKWKRYLF